MSLRFRKSMKIAPGVKLNFSKNGVGMSIGTKGARMSISPTGRVTRTLGIPGTGIYDVETISTGNKKKSKANNKNTTQFNTSPTVPFYTKTWFTILMLLLFFPIGLYTMWKFMNWNKIIKIGISALFVIWFILYLI